MSSQIVKNSRYSKDIEVHDYIPLLHSLGSNLFDEGPNDIRRYLKKKASSLGPFYDSHEFSDELKFYFYNHDVYLAFKEHPMFKYIYLDRLLYCSQLWSPARPFHGPSHTVWEVHAQTYLARSLC